MKPQMSLFSATNREPYRGYEIAKVPGLIPYAIVGDGGIITLRPTIESARERIDKLVGNGPTPEAVQAPEPPEAPELPDDAETEPDTPGKNSFLIAPRPAS